MERALFEILRLSDSGPEFYNYSPTDKYNEKKAKESYARNRKKRKRLKKHKRKKRG